MLRATAGPDAGHAVVTREHGRLRVVVHAGPPVTHSERSRASVRIVQALRELDPFAAGIDVGFDPPGAV
jgi:hypothetical protein